MAYTKQEWKDGAEGKTPINAERLNHMESGIADGQNVAAPTADTLSGATAVGKSVMKAVDAAAARSAIGAGTSSLKLGSTATTAMPGNTHIPGDIPEGRLVPENPNEPDYVLRTYNDGDIKWGAVPFAKGSYSELVSGVNTYQKIWSAKDIADYVKSQIAAAAAG